MLFPRYLFVFLSVLICDLICLTLIFQPLLFFCDQCSVSCTLWFHFSFINMTFLIFCFTALLRTCHIFSSPFLFLLLANEIVDQSKNPILATYKPCIRNSTTLVITWKSEVLWQHKDTLAVL